MSNSLFVSRRSIGDVLHERASTNVKPVHHYVRRKRETRAWKAYGYACRDISKYSTSVVRSQDVQNDPYERSRGQFLVRGRPGQRTGNLRAHYRPRMSSTPETGSLACTTIVYRFGPLGAYTKGHECSIPLKAARAAYSLSR